MIGDRRFEDILDECIASVAEGRRTVEECLAVYPQWADRLEPLIRLGVELRHVYAAQPSALHHAEARERFLAAAREPRRAARAPGIPGRLRAALWAFRFPQSVGRPALAALAAVVLALIVFPSFLFATSGDAMPGDWRYPVKRTSERLRFAFVFGEDARRSFRIGLAEERLEELEALAARKRPIEESAIRELVSHTEPLVEDLDPQNAATVPQEHVKRIEVLTAKENDVLDQVEPFIGEDAANDLEEAKELSHEGQVRALAILSLATAEEAAIAGVTATPAGTPQPSPASASATPADPIATPADPTAEPTGTAVATGTAPAGDVTVTPAMTPAATPTATPSGPARTVVSLPDDSTGGIPWSLMTIGDFSAVVPNHLDNGWVVSSQKLDEPDELLFIGHRVGRNFDVVVTIKVGSGEASVYAFVDGASQRIGVEDVASAVPSASEIVFHILDSISIDSS